MRLVRSSVTLVRRAMAGAGVGGVLARGSLGSIAVKVSAAGLLFGMHVLLARMLGVRSYGNYVYVITWVQLLALFATAGMDSASTRFVAEYRAKGEVTLLRGFLNHALTLSLALSVLIALGLLFIVQAFAPRLESELVRTFRWGAVLIPIVAVAEVRSGALRGFKRVVYARMPVEVLRPGFVIMSAAALWLLSRDALDAPVTMLLSLGGAFVALVVVESVLRRQHGRQDGSAEHAPLPRRDWSSVGVQLLLVAGFLLVIAQTDTLMLGAIRGTTDAGIYAIGARVAGFVSFALLAVNVIIGPQIAELYAAERHRELQRVLTLGARVSLGFATLVVFAVVPCGKAVLRLVGDEFIAAWPALLILVVGHVGSCAAGLAGTLLMMTGRQALVVLVLGVGACLNLGLNALLIPRFGMVGAAAATASVVVLWNSALVYVSLETVGIDPTPIGLRGGLPEPPRDRT